MTNLDIIFKSRDITLPTKVRLVKAMVFPVVMYGCESWTIKKAECQRLDALELWCWRSLLKAPWTSRSSNQSVLKEISPEYSLAAAAAVLLQSCPTLCDPIDGSPPGSPVPGILQARTRVGCHFLLQCVKVKGESEVAQSCPTLSDPMDCSLPSSSVQDRKSTRLNSSHHSISYAVFCLKKKRKKRTTQEINKLVEIKYHTMTH